MVFAAEGLRAVAAVPSSSKTIPKDLTYTGSDQNPEFGIGASSNWLLMKSSKIILNYEL